LDVQSLSKEAQPCTDHVQIRCQGVKPTGMGAERTSSLELVPVIGQVRTKRGMCQRCVKDPFPQRDRFCSETGAYLVNLKGCVQCSGKIGPLKEAAREEVDQGENPNEDNPDLVEFKHVCPDCNHCIAEHSHTFWIEGSYQEYRMDCLLCGIGEDSCPIDSNTRRKPQYS